MSLKNVIYVWNIQKKNKIRKRKWTTKSCNRRPQNRNWKKHLKNTRRLKRFWPLNWESDAATVKKSTDTHTYTHTRTHTQTDKKNKNYGSKWIILLREKYKIQVNLWELHEYRLSARIYFTCAAFYVVKHQLGWQVIVCIF